MKDFRNSIKIIFGSIGKYSKGPGKIWALFPVARALTFPTPAEGFLYGSPVIYGLTCKNAEKNMVNT